ncbi:TadE/TadG family type IV pilus assembly protein [Aminobacter sp. P9b]|uniref:Flp pilus assembly protein TadG n=1 Tax=Aminobacter niigataensis TaxID=83265 RepID=A0ABR6L770_9HYPH|nr:MULTISPECIES: TadE/TadG family type IV pilus assembly protein [Aminobacter]AWC25767.1 Flp pilus assembly protein TadG [Aminobacter sp. MSH1]MBB4652646.1 Flp pilus assembly protein TadG [Aminobacter niigataensis]CAI2936428.1 Flp pilus assembly protein TadG [Aminobacter niigataensis]
MSDTASAVHDKTKARRRGLFAGFARDRSGSTAIEFVMLVIPFSLLVFAILESCISFAGQQVLSNAVDDVARQLRTGQVKSKDVTKDWLEGKICERLEVIVADGCPNLIVDLRSYPTFAAAADVKLRLTGREIDTTGISVTPGPAGTKNMLRVFYKWPVITDFMRASMSNLNGGYTLQFASAIWQNEPFND